MPSVVHAEASDREDVDAALNATLLGGDSAVSRESQRVSQPQSARGSAGGRSSIGGNMLSLQVTDLPKSSGETKAELRASRSKITELVAKVNELNSGAAKLKKSIHDLTLKVNNSDAKIINLEATVALMGQKVDSLSARVDSLEAKVDRFNEEILKKLEQMYTDLSAEQKSLFEQVEVAAIARDAATNRKAEVRDAETRELFEQLAAEQERQAKLFVTYQNRQAEWVRTQSEEQKRQSEKQKAATDELMNILNGLSQKIDDQSTSQSSEERKAEMQDLKNTINGLNLKVSGLVASPAQSIDHLANIANIDREIQRKLKERESGYTPCAESRARIILNLTSSKANLAQSSPDLSEYTHAVNTSFSKLSSQINAVQASVGTIKTEVAEVKKTVAKVEKTTEQTKKDVQENTNMLKAILKYIMETLGIWKPDVKKIKFLEDAKKIEDLEKGSEPTSSSSEQAPV